MNLELNDINNNIKAVEKKKNFEKEIEARKKSGTRYDWRQESEIKKLYIYNKFCCCHETLV